MHRWMREQDVGNYVAREQFAPLNAKYDLRQVGDCGSWVGVLLPDQTAESQRSTEQLNMRVAEPGMIAKQFLIYRVFKPCPEYRVQKVRSDKYRKEEDTKNCDDPVGDT